MSIAPTPQVPEAATADHAAVLPQVPGRDGAASDPVRDAIEALGGLTMGYDMSTATAGDKGAAVLMVADEIGSGDIYGDASLKFAIGSGPLGNCGSSDYISNHILIKDGASAKIGAAAAASGAKSIWGMVECDFTSYAGSPWYLQGGTAGAPANTHATRIDTGFLNLARGGTANVLTASPAPSGVKTYFFGYSYHAGTNTTYYWLCDASGAWASRQTASYFGNRISDGICFGSGFGAPSPNGSKWLPGTQSSTEYAEGDFQAIFEACKQS